MKNVLMIAYAFPPLNFSGTARPLGFARYLCDFGWRPTVLTRQGTGRFSSDEQMLSGLEGKCDIRRVSPGDNDDWASWVRQKLGFLDMPFQLLRLGSHRFTESFIWRAPNYFPNIKENVHWGRPAFKAALKLAEQKHFDLIWATGDPWSSLVTGYRLSKKLNLPFIADIRDPWTYGVMWNPATPRIAKWNQAWEQKILSHAARTVFTSPLTRDIYRSRVKKESAHRIVSITNGFDNCEPLDASSAFQTSDRKCRFCFVGNLTARRDPQILIEAFKRARESISSDQISLHFVGRITPYEKIFEENFIAHTPSVTQDQSRQYMRFVDVLVLLQASMSDGADVISGKAYEYLVAGKPILAVVPETGGDAWLMKETHAGIVTGTTDPSKIALAIEHYWQLWKQNKLISSVTPDQLARFSRSNLTRELVAIFDQVLSEQGAIHESQ